MAISQAGIDRLEAALVSGELTVEYDGTRITYRSTDDLRKAIAYAREQLNVAAGRPSRTTQTYAVFTRD